ncbi:MAG: MarR family winged helix-turn-helix transcriptional regulator [Acidimicrobiales bacterium]
MVIDPAASEISGAADAGNAGNDSYVANAGDVGDDVEMAARLRLAVTRLFRVLRRQVVGGCTPAQVSVLATVARLGVPTLGELAAAEQVQPPSMTRSVDGLETAGLVRRLLDHSDGRVVRVEVTTSGQRTLARIRSLRTAVLVQRMRRLSDDERRAVTELVPILEKLVADQ